jgi:Mce-associated membrane protein
VEDQLDHPGAGVTRTEKTAGSQPAIEPPPGAARPSANPVVLVAALAAITVACLTMGTVFVVKAIDKRGGTPDNIALVDQARTQEVISQVSADVVKIFSYNYASAAASQQAAQSVLVDPGRQQYLTLFKLLQSKAPGQKLTLVVKVVQVGVITLSGSNARLLVFLDQTSTRAPDNASSTTAAQLQISAVEHGGSWLVNGITPY